MYLKCFEHESRRADPLYFIGAHYLQAGDHNKAYHYLKVGFEIGIPVGLTSNLRPDLYNRYLPELLIPLCYEFDDYNTGFKASERLISYTNTTDETIISFYKIFELLIQNKKAYRKKHVKKILCFVAPGNYNKWQGSTINKSGIGGSETYIIEMSRNVQKLTDDFSVYVFCN